MKYCEEHTYGSKSLLLTQVTHSTKVFEVFFWPLRLDVYRPILFTQVNARLSDR